MMVVNHIEIKISKKKYKVKLITDDEIHHHFALKTFFENQYFFLGEAKCLLFENCYFLTTTRILLAGLSCKKCDGANNNIIE